MSGIYGKIGSFGNGSISDIFTTKAGDTCSPPQAQCPSGANPPFNKPVESLREYIRFRDWDNERARQLWQNAVVQANQTLTEQAHRIGETPILLSPDDEALYWASMNSIDQKCLEIMNRRGGGQRYYGCTDLDKWTGNTAAPYVQPPSRTYLTYYWAKEHLANAMAHELSHTKLFVLRQMISKALQRNGFSVRSGANPYVDDLLRRVEEVNRRLDEDDVPKINPWTGDIEIERTSEIDTQLPKLVDMFLSILSQGGRR